MDGRIAAQGYARQCRQAAIWCKHRQTAQHRRPLTLCPATLSLHSGDTTVSVPVTTKQVDDMGLALKAVLAVFAEKQAAQRPKRYKAMEYKHTGTAPELQYLELFCNPNAATNAFGAKVLITVKTHDGVSVLTETPLTALKADLDLCREQNAVPV